jgi:hypothetical protein
VLFFIATAASLTGNFAYGQQSHNLTNLIPTPNDPVGQHQISGGLIIIPSLSANDLAVGVERPESNEDGQQVQGQVQGLIPQQTTTDLIKRKEQAEDKIIRDSPDQRGGMQQVEVEEKIGEIQKQHEDREEKIKENLEAAETKTRMTLEEWAEEEHEAHHQDNDDKNGKEEEKDNFNNNKGIRLELPFP